jgi:hypothetical protein
LTFEILKAFPCLRKTGKGEEDKNREEEEEAHREAVFV